MHARVFVKKCSVFLSPLLKGGRSARIEVTRIIRVYAGREGGCAELDRLLGHTGREGWRAGLQGGENTHRRDYVLSPLTQTEPEQPLIHLPVCETMPEL